MLNINNEIKNYLAASLKLLKKTMYKNEPKFLILSNLGNTSNYSISCRTLFCSGHFYSGRLKR